MKQTALRKVSAKREAAEADGTYVKPSRKPLQRNAQATKGTVIKSTGTRGKRLKPALKAAYAVAIERGGGTCQAPGCGREATEVHHLHTRSARPDLREDHRNLAHLCEPCHSYWQKRGAKFRQIFAKAYAYFGAIYNDALDVLKVGEVEG